MDLVAHVVIERIGPILAELEEDAAGPTPPEIVARLAELTRSEAPRDVVALLCAFISAPREHSLRERDGELLVERSA